MKATKGNKTYTIDESQKKFYVDGGFDIFDDGGELVTHGRGKTVSYEKYEEALAEKDARIAELEKTLAEKTPVEKTPAGKKTTASKDDKPATGNEEGAPKEGE